MADKPSVEASLAVTEEPDTVKIEVSVWHEMDDDNPILALVGRVASQWSFLETMLDHVIYRLSGLSDHQGACITSQLMGVWPRVNSIKALLTFHLPAIPTFKSTISTLNKFGTDCQGPSEKRNRVIHDPWWSAGGDSSRVAQSRSMPKGKLTHGLEEIDPASLIALCVAIHSLRERAINLFAEVDAELRASPREPPSAP